MGKCKHCGRPLAYHDVCHLRACVREANVLRYEQLQRMVENAERQVLESDLRRAED